MKYALLFCLSLFCAAAMAEPLGTAFTYQGDLQYMSGSANGTFDFQMELFDAVTAGSSVATAIQIENVNVSDGIFTVELDFGISPFNGDQLWLEIGVREGTSVDAYTGLVPRQILTAVPFALHAVVDNEVVQLRVDGSCPLGHYLRGINADGSVVCERLPGVPTLSTIDSSSDTGKWSSITIGSDGLPVISYFEDGGTEGRLRFAHCSNASCTSSSQRTLEFGPNVTGEFTSIAIGMDGFPIISFYDQAASSLRVVHCEDVLCGNRSTTTIDHEGPVGQWTSIAIGSDGWPIILYYDADNADLKAAHCENLDCTKSTFDTAISTGGGLGGSPDIGKYSSIAIAGNDLPVLSTYDEGEANLQFARCLSLECDSVSQLAVDSTDDVGQWSSIAIGSDGLAIISYYDATNMDLKILHCNNATCTSQTITRLESAADDGQWTSIAIGVDGLPVVSYWDGSSFNLKIALCSNLSCTSSTVVEADQTVDQVGEHSSIAIGADGLPIVSYYDFSHGDLKVVKCGGGCL